MEDWRVVTCVASCSHLRTLASGLQERLAYGERLRPTAPAVLIVASFFPHTSFSP